MSTNGTEVGTFQVKVGLAQMRKPGVIMDVVTAEQAKLGEAAVACWGWDEYGVTTPPAGEFTSVSAGENHTCGVKTDGTVSCWGADNNGRATPPAGEFTSVSSGYHHACGVRIDGAVACWGADSNGRATPPAGEFTSVSARVPSCLRGEDRRRRRLLGL